MIRLEPRLAIASPMDTTYCVFYGQCFMYECVVKYVWHVAIEYMVSLSENMSVSTDV